MKRAYLIVIFALLVTFTSCIHLPENAEKIPLCDPLYVGFNDNPSGSPDDIVATPGGIAYRANVINSGKNNPWPPYESDNTSLGGLHISYRAVIETKRGKTRNNIIGMREPGGLSVNVVVLYAIGVPHGIELFMSRGGGLPETEALLLMIDIGEDVSPGEYKFEVGIELDKRYYGAIPCTLNVIQ